MNIKMILLGIFMFVVLYFLYKILIGNKVVKATNLRYDYMIPYSYASASIPNATRYSYYIWVHGNTLDSSMANIFKVNEGATVIFSLDIINNTNLQVTVKTSSKDNSFLISNNFPIQSWEQVIISFDNMNMDTYINGQFVKSILFNSGTTGLPVQTSTTTNITFGVGDVKPDIDIRLFDRLEYSMDPQTAWNLYKSDKSASDGASSTNYGLNLNLSTNNKLQAIRIF
jgi:hypothetical protein